MRNSQGGPVACSSLVVTLLLYSAPLQTSTHSTPWLLVLVGSRTLGTVRFGASVKGPDVFVATERPPLVRCEHARAQLASGWYEGWPWSRRQLWTSCLSSTGRIVSEHIYFATFVRLQQFGRTNTAEKSSERTNETVSPRARMGKAPSSLRKQTRIEEQGCLSEMYEGRGQSSFLRFH